MTGPSGLRPRAIGWVALVAAVCVSAALATSARAEVVRLPDGRLAGVQPVAGVSPTSLPGSQAKSASLSGLSTNGNLNYHGGPVLHASVPYLIFWDPAGAISSGERVLLERYFADSAADSGNSSNVFGVDRQFTDSTGFADYSQSWASAHAINDTQPYPTAGDCTDTPVYSETVCLFDSQLQAEVTRLITAGSLPTGTGGSAPIYFVVTPPSVNSCFPGSPGTPDECADNVFCAYHSSFVTRGGKTVLYADIPTVLAVHSPKGCQADGFRVVQSPNGDATADVTIKYMSHEFNETITDPLGTAWWDSNSGNEDGDNCNIFGSTADPQGGDSPNAFAPVLGGSSGSGTLFNQLINGDGYYTQSEWSNGNVGCELRPATATISAAFSGPSTANPNAQVTFDASASASKAGYTSVTWNFGDGSTSFAVTSLGPGTRTHTFSSAGGYTVTLTLVDQFGNVSTVSHQITIGTITAAFTFSPAHPLAGTSVSFDGSGSSSPIGGITSYAWTFGDGSTGSGVKPTHPYTAAGTYTVSLTVTDAKTNQASVSHSVTVVLPPAAAFTDSPAHPLAGSSVAFDGSGSSAPSGASISSYAWTFGDGSSGSGVTPTHAYSAAGTYPVLLTVTDSFGHTGSVSQSVTVAAAGQPGSPPPHGVPSALISVATTHPVAGAAVGFSGAGSTDSGSTIVSYAWNFGDGTTGSGAQPTHTYTRTGGVTVRLTVTDATGSTSTTSRVLKVAAASIGTVHLKAGVKVETLTIALTGPGTLRFGKAHITVRGATSVRLTIKLSRSQRATLRRRGKLTLRVTLRFTPRFGAATTRRYKIRLTLR